MNNLKVIQERVEFLQKQLESLEHYLPDTYQLLMEELDLQSKQLMRERIKSFYQEQQK